VLEGLEVFEVSRYGRKAYKDREGLVYLDCNKCGEIILVDDFRNHKRGLLKKQSHCKYCMNNYVRENKEYFRGYRKDNRERLEKLRLEYYRKNKEKLAESRRKYLSENKEKVSEKKRIYNKQNLEKGRIYTQRRRARKRALPDTLTLEQMNQLGTTCFLTGKENVHLDHVIPLVIGHGGTTYENIIPLSAELNVSKQDSNVFEWAEQNHEWFGFTMDRFNEVMTDVADRNGMTLEEYRDYVYWCFENPVEVTA